MSTVITDVREAMRDALSGVIEGQVSAYTLTSPQMPAIHIFPDEINYDESGSRGIDSMYFAVQAFAAQHNDEGPNARGVFGYAKNATRRRLFRSYR